MNVLCGVLRACLPCTQSTCRWQTGAHLPLLPLLPTQLHVSPQTTDGVQVLADPPMHQVLPLWTYPVCSSLCSATASIVTHPIDVVKTRLQVLSNRAGSEGAGGGGAGQRMTAWQVG